MSAHSRCVSLSAGKIVSSIEKEEDNLKTGQKTYFDSHAENSQR